MQVYVNLDSELNSSRIVWTNFGLKQNTLTCKLLKDLVS